MNSQKIKKQLRKLFSREVGRQPEIDDLNQWYASLIEQTEVPENLNQLKADSWNNILDKTQAVHRKKLKERNFYFDKWIWKAAVFLGIWLSGHVLLSSSPEEEGIEKLAAGIYTNDIGKVSTFFLPDGSQIWLSTGSKLEYVEDFPRNRKIKLSGEAFFKVKPNPNYPFQITTGTLSTIVLGTSFNLKAYEKMVVELSVYSRNTQLCA